MCIVHVYSYVNLMHKHVTYPLERREFFVSRMSTATGPTTCGTKTSDGMVIAIGYLLASPATRAGKTQFGMQPPV